MKHSNTKVPLERSAQVPLIAILIIITNIASASANNNTPSIWKKTLNGVLEGRATILNQNKIDNIIIFLLTRK